MNFLSSAELKNLAKKKLYGNYGNAILIMIVVYGIDWGVSLILNWLVPYTGVLSQITFFGIQFIVSLFLGLFQVGYAYFYLKLCCGTQTEIQDVFYGFKHNPSRSMVIVFIFSVASNVLLSPYLYCFQTFLITLDMNLFQQGLLFLLIGGSVYYIISLFLSQCYYLLLDFPDYTAKEILSTSFKLMKKHWKRLLYIHLSFVPLMFFGAFTCGIGLLWVVPYCNATYTEFYLDLMKKPEA